MNQEPFDQMQRLPSEFGQADAMRLQQFNAALSQAKQQADDGEISHEDAEVLTQGILRLRAPLLQAQEAQKELIKKNMVQQIQEDGALAQGMQQQDAVFRAQGFRERVAQFTDPMTGATAFMFEESPQKWAQIDFGSLQKGTEGLEGQTAFGGAGFPGAGETGELEPTGTLADEPGTSPESGVPGGTPEGPSLDPGKIDWGKSGIVPNPETGGHTLEIWNGPNRQLAHFDGSGRIVAQEFFDQQGNPVQQGQPGQQSMSGEPMPMQLNDHELNVLRGRAELMVPAIPPPEVQTPETMRMYQSGQMRRSQQVATAFRSLANQELQARQSQWRQKQMVSEHQRLEQVKAQQAEQAKTLKEKEGRKKEYQASAEKYNDRVLSLASEIAKEHFEDTGVRMSREERVEAAKKYLASAGFTEPTDPDAPAKPEDPVASAEPGQPKIDPEVRVQTSAIAEKAKATGDVEAAAAAEMLAQIMSKYRTLKEVPEEQRAEVMALVERIQRYREGNKPAPMAPTPKRDEPKQGVVHNPSYRGGP